MELNDIIDELKKGSYEIIGLENIVNLIKKYYETGQNFYVKIGMDPTAADLHLGHTVVLKKMAFLQSHGAIIQFLIGDFTARIGDPSGKSVTRKVLSEEEVNKNAKTYQDQVFKILDPNKTEIKFNSHWLGKLGTSGLIALAGTFSVARMLERDDFTKRYQSGTSIAISEFLYPLLQGYDSVELKSDVEMGGSDQKFNLLMGRTLQRIYETGKEQSVFMMPLLVGLDGVNKMSKSLGNYIGVTENPNDMFAKVLSISDELMWDWYELLSKKSIKEINELKQAVLNGNLHPKKAKENLALEIVSDFHGSDLALKAQNEFNLVHSKGEIPSDLSEFNANNDIWIVDALRLCKLTQSGSDARRAIKSNAVSVNQKKINDEQMRLGVGEYVLQVGKKSFAKLKVK